MGEVPLLERIMFKCLFYVTELLFLVLLVGSIVGLYYLAESNPAIDAFLSTKPSSVGVLILGLLALFVVLMGLYAIAAITITKLSSILYFLLTKYFFRYHYHVDEFVYLWDKIYGEIFTWAIRRHGGEKMYTKYMEIVEASIRKAYAGQKKYERR